MFSRLMNIMRAKFSRLLGKAEDPGEMLDYAYEKQLEKLQEFRRGIADLVTAKKRIQMQAEAKQKEVAKLDKAARTALAQGNESLAKQAIERKQFISEELVGLDTQIAELETQQEALLLKEKQVQQKVQRFRTQKEVTKAQYKAAQATVGLQEAAAGLGSELDGGGLALQRAHEKVETMKARAGALDELEQRGALTDLSSGESDIDRQISAMTSTANVDDELSKLKEELGIASAPTLEKTDTATS